MNPLEKLVSEIQSIYRPNERTLLGFSGGADSTALFFSLLELKKKHQEFYFEAFHLNHKLRPLEADRDENFVTNICALHKITLHVYQKDIQLFAESNKMSLEEAGRKVRYDLMNEIIKETKLESISTAHHMDDQMELFLIRLFQGAGLKTLAGMKERDGIKVRPFLKIKKNELLNALEFHKIEFKVDSTNFENSALRNQVRNLIIPRILETFPMAQNKINQLQELIRTQDEFVQDFLIPWTVRKHQVFFSLENFRKLPVGIRKNQLVLGLKTLSKEFYLTTKNLDEIEKLIERWDGTGHKILVETKEFQLMATQGYLFFIHSLFYQSIIESFILENQNFFAFGNKRIENKTGSLLKFQRSRPGQMTRFNKSRKLSDFLTDQKIFYHWRKKIYSIEDETGKWIGIFDWEGSRLFLLNEYLNLLQII